MTAQSFDPKVEGAVALVTGAAGGIGQEIVHRLAACGATVVGTDVQLPEGSQVECVTCDVTQREQVDGLVQDVVARHGSLDILVHAAGVTRDGVLWKLTDDQWRGVMDVNLDAAFWLIRAAAPHLRKSEKGSVVFISSINGERGKFGQSNYAASKSGLIGLAKSAARELGRDGTRVNVVAPGLIMTPMTKKLPEDVTERAVSETVLGHAGTPQDVADAVLFLSSRLAKHVTGQVLRVDGGQLIA